MYNSRIKKILLIAPFIAIITIVVVAICAVMVQSLGIIRSYNMTTPTLEYYAEVLRDEDFLASLGVSLRIAWWASFWAAILGTLLAAALVKRNQARGGMLYVVRMPILVPHAVVAIFVIAIFAQTGLIARIAYMMGFIADYTEFPQILYTPNYIGVILAYLWKEIPFVAFFTLALMTSISETLGEAAENLGASPLRAFFTVTLPLSLPAIVKAVLIIFVFAFGGYELVFLLGATLPRAIGVEAYLTYISPNLTDKALAMAQNGIILIVSAIVALLYALIIRHLTKQLGGGRR